MELLPIDEWSVHMGDRDPNDVWRRASRLRWFREPLQLLLRRCSRDDDIRGIFITVISIVIIGIQFNRNDIIIMITRPIHATHSAASIDLMEEAKLSPSRGVDDVVLLSSKEQHAC